LERTKPKIAHAKKILSRISLSKFYLGYQNTTFLGGTCFIGSN